MRAELGVRVEKEDSAQFRVEIDSGSGAYKIIVNDRITLTTDDIIGLQIDNTWFSPSSKNIKVSSASQYMGSDSIGRYQAYKFKWDLQGKDFFNFFSEILVYESGQDVVFRQSYVDGNNPASFAFY